MSDFAERTRKRLADERAQQEIAAEDEATRQKVFVEKQRIKKSLGPDLWEHFRSIIVRKCNEINKLEGSEHYRPDDSMPNTLIVIELNPIRKLRLDFDSRAFVIRYSAGLLAGEYHMEVEEGTGKIVLLHQDRGMKYPSSYPADLETSAEGLLEECLAKADPNA